MASGSYSAAVSRNYSAIPAVAASGDCPSESVELTREELMKLPLGKLREIKDRYAAGFNANLHKLVNTSAGIRMTADEKDAIRNLKTLINLCIREDADFIIDRSVAKFVYFLPQITARDGKYFTESAEYKRFIVPGSHYASMQEILVDVCKRAYRQVSEEERNVMWDITRDLLEQCLRHKQIMGILNGKKA